jgi:hypothetical protein
MGFAAEMPRLCSIGRREIPLMDGKRLIPTINHKPVNRILFHDPANLTLKFFQCTHSPEIIAAPAVQVSQPWCTYSQLPRVQFRGKTLSHPPKVRRRPVKDLYAVLLQKEKEAQRVRQEIEALRNVLPLLAESPEEQISPPKPQITQSNKWPLEVTGAR